MYKTLIAIILIIMMCGMSSAEQVEEWPFGQRNVMPDYIEGVMYDFEEGSNCGDFDNQYPEIATFLTVLGTQPYGTSDWPSYVTVGGSTCGNTRCYMRIYPWCGYYPNGTPHEYVFVVNGRSAFSPMTGPDVMGGFIPGMKTHIVFKEDTRYVSFLATTSGNMYVTLYDKRGNRIHSEKITVTILRDGTKPSNFTQFSYHSDVDIVSMKISGPFNGNHLDDLIIGGAPGYLPDQPTDYSWAAERLKLLIGAPHNPNGFGYEFISGTFYPAEDIVSNPLVVNWDYENKEWITGEGINNEGAIIWALNRDANIINNLCINDMESKDFKVHVEYGDQQPGDVAFIEYDITATDEGSLGYDEIIMFIEPQIDPDTGMAEDCIRILEDGGVHYADSEFIHALYGTDIGIIPTSLFTVKRMPDEPKGNKKSPYPNIPGKFI
ncbi:MAG: hypothetical protein KAQ89_00435 [Planctomycetes bacterium]|nr:hypothetical protein [Planctomycetota bacterium]